MPEERVRVVIFGNTLVLAGLQASLVACAGLEVRCIEELVADDDLGALRPDVVIVDLSSIRPTDFRLVAGTAAGLHIIGVDGDENRVLIWSGKAYPTSSLRDLLDLIGQYSLNPPKVASSQ